MSGDVGLTLSNRLVTFKFVREEPRLLLARSPLASLRWGLPLIAITCCAAFSFQQSTLTSRPTSYTIHPFKTPLDADAARQQAIDRPPVMPQPKELDDKAATAAATPKEPPTTQPLATASTGAASATGRTISAAQYYGLWAIAPAVVAIIIAILTRQVLVALPLGILASSAMMMWLGGVHNPIFWVTNAVDRYLFGVLAMMNENNTGVDYSHLKILTFTLLIGAMVGVIETNGGTRAMVARVTRHMKTRNRGQLGAWVAGLLVFFDDYANAMIVGPSMRPLFDRLSLSREKLAYIVDSTAAPVASVFIGTWLVTEISYIDTGLADLGSHRPAFLATMSGSTAFWNSLPYRTYAWLALVMVFWIALTGRDFGAMRKAESRAAGGEATPEENLSQSAHNDGRGWWLAVVPVAFLVLMTVALLLQSGWHSYAAKGNAIAFDSWDHFAASITGIMGAANSYTALLYASLCSAVLAIFITLASRAATLGKTMDAVVSGMSRMFAACIVLVLAWGLSEGGKDLQLGQVASDYLKHLEETGVFSVSFLPMATFITASIVSFATGTSWGTMGILCPAVVAISARLFAGMPEDQALVLFYATVGAVLTGAVFGDHCSPISDTTVLSSIASQCELGAHVWTQMPYALVVAFVGILCTDLFHYGVDRWAHGFFVQNEGLIVYIGTAAGAVVLLLILLLFGRRPKLSRVQPIAATASA